MAKDNSTSWRFNRQINLSVLVQLLFLASLIVGSWVNLQRQLDSLQRDVTYLCQCQKNFEQKLESLSAKSISYEYRLRALEKRIPEDPYLRMGYAIPQTSVCGRRDLFEDTLKERSDEKDVSDTNLNVPFIAWLR